MRVCIAVAKGAGASRRGHRVDSPAINWRKTPGAAAYSMVEVVISLFLLGTLTLALFGALSSGVSTVQSARENIRATQIMMQKMETIRLFNWQQSTNPALASPSFTDYYDPLGTSTSKGTVYKGTVSVQPAPASVPATLRPSVRLVTVTITWTNFLGHRQGILQTRQIETLIARHGMQNYVY